MTTHDPRVYPEIAFGGYTRVDGTVDFYGRINALLRPEHVVLDVGCGRGAGHADPIPFRRALRDLRGKCRRVIGLDPDPRARENPLLDEFVLLEDLRRWPMAAGSIDVLIADFVLEHVDEPDAFFGEVRRVLRPGGYFCFRTANAIGYVGLVARLVPNALHARVLARVQEARRAEDVFPTRYRCNTLGTLRRLLERYELEGHVYAHSAEPSYWSFSRPLYRLAARFHRWAPSSLQTSIFGFARRHGGGD